MQAAVNEGRTMAKKQRTTQQPGEVLELLDTFEATTGVKGNRVLLAAILKYFCDPQQSDPTWLQLAVALERGQIKLEDVPFIMAQRKIDHYGSALPKVEPQIKGLTEGQINLAYIKAQHNFAAIELRALEESAEARGGRLAALIARFAPDDINSIIGGGD
jgi:hypothetical protein